MKKTYLAFLLIISLLLASCTSPTENENSTLPAESSEEAAVSADESSEESSNIVSEEISEESEESEESKEIILPEEPAELYMYAMSLIENSVSSTMKTEATYDLFQSDEPEPVLSYTASTVVRLQEVNEHDKRLDFVTTLSIDGISSQSRLLYIDGVGYYDENSEKIKQAMSFEKALTFLGNDGDTISFTPDMFGKITCDDLRSGKRIELTEIIDVEKAASLVPDTMNNGKIEDLRVTLYINADGTPAAEVVGMRMQVESEHKNIEIHCEVIQTTSFSDIGSTVVKNDINADEYKDGIIFRN